MPNFTGGEAVDRWLKRIAKNHCHDIWRGQARAEALGRPADPAVEHADPASARLAGQCVDRLAVETMLRNLGRRDASLLVQRHIGDVPVGTLAAQWGLTRGAMDVALHRARLRARRLAEAEGLRALLPIALLRRITAAVQRLGTVPAETGAAFVGVCNIIVAVALGAPDMPPAYADSSGGRSTAVHAAAAADPRSLPAADLVARRPSQQVRPAGRSDATGTALVRDPVPKKAPRRDAKEGSRSDTTLGFDPVVVPSTGSKVSSAPPEKGPKRAIGVRPTETEVEEIEDEPVTKAAKPVFGAGCTVAEAGDPVTYCEE